jgi:hypothetical protein
MSAAQPSGNGNVIQQTVILVCVGGIVLFSIFGVAFHASDTLIAGVDAILGGIAGYHVSKSSS